MPRKKKRFESPEESQAMYYLEVWIAVHKETLMQEFETRVKHDLDMHAEEGRTETRDFKALTISMNLDGYQKAIGYLTRGKRSLRMNNQIREIGKWLADHKDEVVPEVLHIWRDSKRAKSLDAIMPGNAEALVTQAIERLISGDMN